MEATTPPAPRATPERRKSPRVEMALSCTFSRRNGSIVSGHTIDVGPGGMRVSTIRPLAVDEVLDFELPPDGLGPVIGRARVMRQQTYGIYAMRFERLADAALARLQELADGA